MKITPYLLYMMGFEEIGYKHYYKSSRSPFNSDEKISYDLWYIDDDGKGLWAVVYNTPDQRNRFLTSHYMDLCEFSEVMARNRHGYEYIDPIEIYVPWVRDSILDYDQDHWNNEVGEYVNAVDKMI